jgi:hypothetical protein
MFIAQPGFVALNLVLSISQKILNSVMEWGRYGMFGVRGFSVW